MVIAFVTDIIILKGKEFRRMKKRVMALFLTATLLVGNTLSVFAEGESVVPEADTFVEEEIASGDAAGTDEDGEEAVSDQSAGEDLASGQEMEPDGSAGTVQDPVSLKFGTTYEQGGEEKYYKFSLEKKGSVELLAAAKTGVCQVKIYESSAADSNLVYHCEHDSKDSTELSVKGKIGLRKGVDYFIRVKGLYQPSGLRFQLRYTASEFWEEEIDSPLRVNAVRTDAKEYYHGYISKEDPRDYYSFTLSGDSKVKIWERGKEWMHYLKIYKDKDFSEMIGESTLSDEKGAVIYEGKLSAGTYYMAFEYNGSVWASDYEFAVNTSDGASSEKKYPATGEALINGESVSSLKEAFAGMKDANMEYVVELASDMGSSDKSYEKNLVIPKTAASVTIKGNGHTITMAGTKITANAKLTLENVTIRTINKKGIDAAFTLTAKKDLEIGEDVIFGTTKKKAVNCAADLNLKGCLEVNKLTTKNMNMTSGSKLVAGSKAAITVKATISGESGAEIELREGYKPLAIKGGIAADSSFALSYVNANGEAGKLKDAALILAVNKKLTNEELGCFDVSAIGGDTEGAEYALVKTTAAKAALYPLAFSYNGKDYALWKDMIADMSSLGADASVLIELNSDAYTYGALNLPKAGRYASITIDGKGKKLSFTGNVKLTAPMTLKDISLHGRSAKNVDKAYKISEVVKKGYTLKTEGTVDAGNIILPAAR